MEAPDDHRGMEREFVQTFEFEKRWKALRLDDDVLSVLERTLCANPKAGDVMQGTGGVRKLRVELQGRGKSGGARVVYVDFTVEERTYLITAFAKNERGNLSDREKKEMKDFVARL